MQKEELFRKAVKENEGRIYRICRYYFTNHDDREDAFQESLIRIWEKVGSFRNESGLNTWIYRVVVNTCLTVIRKEKKRKRILEEDKQVESLHLTEVTNGERDEEAEKKVEFFRTFMENLSTLDRMLVSLYLEEFETKEMADVTGLSESNVRVKIHRIKEAVRNQWKEDTYGTG